MRRKAVGRANCEVMMSEETKRSKGAVAANIRFVLAAVAVWVLWNLVASLLFDGHEAKVFDGSVAVDSPGTALVALVALLGCLWLFSVRERGLWKTFREILPVGPLAAVAGLVVYLVTAQSASGPVDIAASVVAGALLLAAFLLAWMICAAPVPGAARAIVFILYVAVCGGVPEAGLFKKASSVGGKPSETVLSPYPDGGGGAAGERGIKVAAERTGLLSGIGTGLSVEKVAVGEDWRDAAVVSPGGFLSAKALVTAGARLRFSVAVRGGGPPATAVVTLVKGGGREEVWRGSTAEMDEGKWTEVSAELSSSGEVDVVFEVNGGEESRSVLFGKARISPEAPPRTNVILLVQDALRADRLGCYGYERATSAEIDSLAGRAVLFEECLAQAPWTIPSMGSILTSLFPTAHGMVAADKGLSPSLDTVAEAFAREGYSTGGIQANPNMSPEAGVAQGFGEYLMLPMREPTAGDRRRYARAGTANAHVDEWLARHAGEPFFLYVHYMDTHMPYVPPAEFDRFGPDPSSKYDGELAYFSSETGKLFSMLASRGLLDNTVVVLTSDHGEQFWEHGAARHGNCLHAEEVHVPLLAWLPGGESARRVKARVSTIDIAPTLLEIAGVGRLSSAQGASLSAATDGGEMSDAVAFGELLTFKPPGQYLVSLTKGRYRFIVSNPDNHWMTRFELYDLEADRGEYINLASRQQHVVVAMKREVDAYLGAQEALNGELISEEYTFPLSDERLRMLQAIGYLGP